MSAADREANHDSGAVEHHSTEEARGSCSCRERFGDEDACMDVQGSAVVGGRQQKGVVEWQAVGPSADQCGALAETTVLEALGGERRCRADGALTVVLHALGGTWSDQGVADSEDERMSVPRVGRGQQRRRQQRHDNIRRMGIWCCRQGGRGRNYGGGRQGDWRRGRRNSMRQGWPMKEDAV